MQEFWGDDCDFRYQGRDDSDPCRLSSGWRPCMPTASSRRRLSEPGHRAVVPSRRTNMRVMMTALVPSLALLCAAPTLAAETDWKKVDLVFGRPAAVSGAVH